MKVYLDPRSLLTIHATLIHNSNAAGKFRISTDRIIELLAESGIEAESRPTESPDDLSEALRDPGDLIVAAGGDGTIRGVALALAQSELQVPLALAPLGTANNIARTLGLTERTESLLLGLADPLRRPFDLGFIRAPWGEARFLEAFGFGLFAEGMATYGPDEGKSLLRAVRAAFSTLRTYGARDWTLEIDGEDVSGRYLMVEVMNTAAMGLRLRLAPDADPSDGLFDIVLVREDEGVGMGAYLARLAAGELEQLGNITVRRAKTLRLQWNGSPVHFDEEVQGGEGVSGGELAVEIQEGALELYLPKDYVG